VFPWLGKLPITAVKAIDILECLRRLEHQNTPETARRVLQSCGQILRYAMLTDRAGVDVSQNLHRVLLPRAEKHFSSLRSPREVGALLRAIDGYDGRLITKYALRLAPLVFVRPGELCHATWSEFDFVQREWRIPEGPTTSYRSPSATSPRLARRTPAIDRRRWFPCSERTGR